MTRILSPIALVGLVLMVVGSTWPIWPLAVSGGICIGFALGAYLGLA